jgi:transcriptional regulator with XRE-family HTH domain
MRLTRELTDEAFLAELGSRLARIRLNHNMTQSAVAREAGVGRLTVQRIEAGEAVNVVGFLRVLRALDLLDNIEQAIPAPGLSPIQMVELAGRQRQRASGRRARPSAVAAAEPWAWGDEKP